MDSTDVYTKFEAWMLGILKKEKPSKEILGYNIGIFETTVGGYTVYLMGAKKFDAEDSDWACKPNYFPADRYFDFPKEYAKANDRDTIEENILSFSRKFAEKEEFKKSFLNKAEGLTVGFDDGDLHTIQLGTS